MEPISEISQDVLNKLFSSNVIPNVELVQDEQFATDYTDQEKALIKQIADCRRAVVGVDIYHYSQFPTDRQMFIPHVFDFLYEETWHLIRQNFAYLFQEYGKVTDPTTDANINYRKHFISTGDGGFQILDTPIHAMVFILTFASLLRFYNSDLFRRKLFAKIGNIEVRYAITWDELYRYRDNFYGSSIINNSRLQSKDKLNRLLIDQNTYQWFLRRIAGIENMMTLGLSDLKGIKEFADYNAQKVYEGNNALIPDITGNQGMEGIKSVDVQKIGTIKQKQTFLEVYNLHVQAVIHYRHFFGKDKIITLSVGNLNTSGIAIEET